MTKEIYYYYYKFPSEEINSFKVEAIYLVIKDIDEDYKNIYGIDTYYDLHYGKYTNDGYCKYYSLSQLWNDEEIFEYDDGVMKIILSFNKDKIEQCRLQDIVRYETLYGKYVDKCRKIIGGKNGNN